MNIVYMLTRNYYYKLIPGMRSLVEHNPDANIFVLAEDDAVPDLPAKVTVINISGQRYFKPTDPNYWNPYTYINLLKVCLPDLLSVDKVIYLDVDTIVCDDLTPLWKTNVSGKWFAACPEYRGIYKPFGRIYYNAGVLVINLAQMRKDNIVPELVAYLNAYRQPYADQDAWNEIGIRRGMVTTFDVRYNEGLVTGETDDPAIVHYVCMRNWYEDHSIPRREYLDRYLDG